MSRRDEVFKALSFNKPAYVPIYFFNQDQDQSDIVAVEVQKHFLGPGKDCSEWGFTWERMDETMGQPSSNLINTPGDMHNLKQPDPEDPIHFEGVEAFNLKYPDRFRLRACR